MTDARIRPARPGDGDGCADVWMDVGRYYNALDPQIYQVPSSEGLAESFERRVANAEPDQLRLVAEDQVIVDLLVASAALGVYNDGPSGGLLDLG
jgi:hypothetical protein